MSDPYPPGQDRWPPYAAPSGPAAPSPWPAGPPPGSTVYVAAPATGRGLAITAIVLSSVAIVLVLVMVLVTFIGFAGFAMDEGGYGGYSLSGTVQPTDGAVSDTALERAVRSALEDDDSYVDSLTCPTSSKVGQGLVTVCTGDVDDFDWTGVVVFRNDAGRFVLTGYDAY